MSTGGFPYPRCSMYGQMFHVWHIKTCSWAFFRANVGKDSIQICIIFWVSYTYGHLSVITGYFSGIIHSINGVMLVLITGISGHNCSIFRYKWSIFPLQDLPQKATRNPSSRRKPEPKSTATVATSCDEEWSGRGSCQKNVSGRL